VHVPLLCCELTVRIGLIRDNAKVISMPQSSAQSQELPLTVKEPVPPGISRPIGTTVWPKQGVFALRIANQARACVCCNRAAVVFMRQKTRVRFPVIVCPIERNKQFELMKPLQIIERHALIPLGSGFVSKLRGR
jgi:hypothetical protein